MVGTNVVRLTLFNGKLLHKSVLSSQKLKITAIAYISRIEEE